MASFVTGFTRTDPTVPINDVKLRREDIINIDGMYRVMISNPAGTIKFSGYVPETFSIGLSSGWSAPFQGMSLFEVAQEATQSEFNAVNVNGWDIS